MNNKKPIKCYVETEPSIKALFCFINDNIERDDGTPVQLWLIDGECLVDISNGEVGICGTFRME